MLAAGAVLWAAPALVIGAEADTELAAPIEYGVPPAVEEAAPPTTPPITVTSAPPTFEPTTTIPVSSGALDSLPSPKRAIPVEISIPALGVRAAVSAVGNNGIEMEVPATARDVGWYRFGPAPGAPDGSAVLAAHVAWRGSRGVFYDLRDLPAGAEIEIAFDDGSVRTFRSVALTSYGKADLPVDDIFRREGPPVLTLITCGGAFNPSLNSFEDNVVAYAVEVTDGAAR